LTSASDHRRRIDARPLARSESGFTLLEIMATVALVGICILPMLEMRERASQLAYKSGHMLRALAYGERILTDRMLNPARVKDEAGLVEEDPAYEYKLTVEVYDLSTGRVVEEKDASSDFSTTTSFSTTSSFTTGAPGDAGPPGDETKEDIAHQVRRVKVTISWPSLQGEQPEQLVLEGFLPLVEEQLNPDSALGGSATGSSSATGNQGAK
jgi:prepilin-type N-terminal cleavage/methylation domain-containing protein